ncbi:MAG TPA: flagellar basal body P-ring formation chaperone FlgA [Parvibaculum sp.]|jgi:flagella basal body P-ring formation protein FlgA
MSLRVSLATLSLVAGIALSGAASAADLRPSTMVSGDTVTLGDLFNDAGTAAKVIVADAPAPGTALDISVSRISLIARRNGLAWRNTTSLTHVTVSRTGIAVPEAEVSANIASAIAAQTPSLLSTAKLQIDYAGGTPNVQVGENAAPTAKVEQIAFNQRTGNFDALLRAPANDLSAPLRRVSGRAYPITDVPVLARDVTPGDIVHASDIQWIKLPSTRISNNIITTEAGLVGMSPRYPVRTGEPLRTSDLQPPVVVVKGATVDMNYVVGALTLLARGRALQAGAVGDTIDIVNPRSNRTVQGVIQGPNMVRIDAMTAPHITDLKS